MSNEPDLSVELVPFDDVAELVVEAALQNEGGGVSDQALYRFIDEVLYYMSRVVDGNRVLYLQEAKYATKNFIEALREGDQSLLFQPRGLRVDKIIDIEEFAKSKAYYNLGGSIRPRVMEELWKLFHSEHADSYLEVVLAGGIGWGKSFLSEIGLAYCLYKLSCYHNPQLEFGLAPGSSIIAIQQSIKLEQAKRVLFQQMAARMRQSPYFSKYYPFDTQITSELRFPNNVTVMPLASTDTAALGMNTLLGIMDECGFLEVIQDSAKSRGPDEIYDLAEKMYSTIMRRMKSRFKFTGKVPGKLFLISSANYPGDFIDRKVQEAAEHERQGKSPTIFVAKMSQWEAFPPGHFSEETFLVEVGDATKLSRLVDSREDAIDPEDVIEVPVDFQPDFERDLEAAIRDLAGIPVGGSNSFIKQRGKLEESVQRHEQRYGGEQLFSLSSLDILRFSDKIDFLLNPRFFECELDHSMMYAAHVDLALRGDSCGLGVSFFDGYAHVGRSLDWDEGQQRYVQAEAGERPRIVVAGAMEIIPPPGDEIDLDLVCELLIALSKRVNLQWVTADWFQSAAILQRMRKTRNVFGKKIKSCVLSVDRTLTPYAEFKQALRDDRLLMPRFEKLLQECRDLQLDPKKRKVDHPASGSKDISDGVAGSSYVITLHHQKRRKRRGLLRDRGYENREEAQNADVSHEDSDVRRIRRLH